MQNATEDVTATTAEAEQEQTRMTTHWVDITARVGADRAIDER